MSKTILITGTSTGLGGLDDAAKAAGVAVRVLAVDVQDTASVEAAVATIMAAEGRIDVLINNAGAGFVRSTEQAAEQEIQCRPISPARRAARTRAYQTPDQVASVAMQVVQGEVSGLGARRGEGTSANADDPRAAGAGDGTEPRPHRGPASGLVSEVTNPGLAVRARVDLALVGHGANPCEDWRRTSLRQGDQSHA